MSASAHKNPLGPPRPTISGRDGPRGERSNLICRLAHTKTPAAPRGPLSRAATRRGESGQTLFVGWRTQRPPRPPAAHFLGPRRAAGRAVKHFLSAGALSSVRSCRACRRTEYRLSGLVVPHCRAFYMFCWCVLRPSAAGARGAPLSVAGAPAPLLAPRGAPAPPRRPRSLRSRPRSWPRARESGRGGRRWRKAP